MQREFKYVAYVIELINRRDGILENGATKTMFSTIKMPYLSEYINTYP